MKMHRLQHDFSQTAPHSAGIPDPEEIDGRTGTAMMIEMRTKRRWIVSVLDAIAESQDGRAPVRTTIKHGSGRSLPAGQKGFAMRLKAATRPMADAAR
jgi:hypothetical protein